MNLKLTKGLKPDELDEFKEYFAESGRFRKHLIAVLEQEIESVRGAMRDEAHYDSPNWAMIQADKLGKEKAFRTVISLLRSTDGQK